jgi:hypothetical protein
MSVKQNRDPRRKPVVGDVMVSADRSVRKRVDRLQGRGLAALVPE